MEFCVVKLAKNTLFYQTDNKNKKKYQKNIKKINLYGKILIIIKTNPLPVFVKKLPFHL